MSAPWNVLPHGRVVELNDRLRIVTGALPGMPLERVMTVIKLDSGELLVHSAVSLAPPDMEALEAWGRPSLLLVPNGWHRLDAPAWKTRYPALRVFCPAAARKKVSAVVSVDGTYDELPATAPVETRYLDGCQKNEGYLALRAADGVSLIFTDALFNQPHLPGLFGLVYRLIGSSGSPRVPKLVKLAMVRDKKALRAQLAALANTPSLRRVIVAHGAAVEDDPAGFLRAAAATL